VPYKLTPMGTILEGEWDEVMAVSVPVLPLHLAAKQ